MQQRHKRELLQLKNEIKQLGKKGKEKGQAMEKEMLDRHTAEVAAFEATAVADKPLVDPMDKLSLYGPRGTEGEDAPQEPQKMSKAMKRRIKQHEEEKARTERIIHELDNLGETSRMMEERQLRELLQPLEKKVYDIPSDGHCLFRSIEHQLDGEVSHGDLRKLATTTVRAHKDEYMPFFEIDDDDKPFDEILEEYCDEMENTAAWGGDIELKALSTALKRSITVYCAGMPPTVFGDEHVDHDGLVVCYLRHAFGSGEHYNSVVSL